MEDLWDWISSSILFPVLSLAVPGAGQTREPLDFPPLGHEEWATTTPAFWYWRSLKALPVLAFVTASKSAEFAAAGSLWLCCSWKDLGRYTNSVCSAVYVRTEERAEELCRELIRTGKIWSEIRKYDFGVFLTCQTGWSYFPFFSCGLLDNNILGCFLTE